MSKFLMVGLAVIKAQIIGRPREGNGVVEENFVN